ncbi:toxin-antitoxin system HicB family antitoxin [Spongiactinospora sp. TRM90649]|uniref:toxin-antitoxin system HicB family antitoxin n=1 Tax=Spongiactinospora sp. TRM90649 TaxID=3031114 RepID=UPI0023F6811E|nr:toxin-antitoxin system HicB family antitoxin [Spongiactinospora sp. TRM90649]MDF5758056.1 toxin-antitoxin system HicB family antitoxin [Spongiactinospora sp. TRM90649]
MDLTPYVDHLRRELAVAAGAGGDEARALAERLSAALESAVRLALLEALSAAADEITRDLAPGSVEVRLRGREPGFVVNPPPGARPNGEPADATPEPAPHTPLPAVPEAEDGGTARVSLRVPEHLKPRIDEAAAREGLSVNAWLVRAVAAAVHNEERRGRPGSRPEPQTGRRFTGWVR